MNIPVKPFASYKWRWLSVQPSEGLLQPPVFLGVLRALQRHEGEPYSSIELNNELRQIKIDTRTDINLIRTQERNLFRNSGQYWRGTGLVAKIPGKIQLTPLGHLVSDGQFTNDEFAALMVRNTVLPNPKTYKQEEQEKWRRSGLRIKPLKLILEIMDNLGRNIDLSEAYLTPNELIQIVIPLAGAQNNVDEISNAVHQVRTNQLDTSGWPDCAPRANDRRLAREFLLFLGNFGICRTEYNADNYDQKFILDQLLTAVPEADDQTSFLEDSTITDDAIAETIDSEIPIIIERQRISTRVFARTNQPRFRKDVLSAAQGRCLLTNEATPEVLEAAHIVPVGHGGTDIVGNGLCLRVDIHRLFDGGKIRIGPSGNITLNNQISAAVSYSNLPNSVSFPAEVAIQNIEWRTRYL